MALDRVWGYFSIGQIVMEVGVEWMSLNAGQRLPCGTRTLIQGESHVKAQKRTLSHRAGCKLIGQLLKPTPCSGMKRMPRQDTRGE